MDSSRSGLLSTLMMTLPLIVVPAIALLRPPGQLNGVSTVSLDASESSAEDDFLNNELDELTRNFGDSEASGEQAVRKDSPDDLKELFSEEFPGSTESNNRPERKRPADSAKSHPMDSDPFMSGMKEADSSGHSPTTPDNTDGDHAGSAEKAVEQLNAQGALRTMWFQAGAKAPVGFAAFFRGQTELMRIRFEAVGQTRDECARSVLNQVAHWQSQQDARKNR